MFFKTDKLDYLGSPKTKLFFESFFFIGQGTSSTGKWNWNLLGFSSFISILAQCVGSASKQDVLILMSLQKLYTTQKLWSCVSNPCFMGHIIKLSPSSTSIILASWQCRPFLRWSITFMLQILPRNAKQTKWGCFWF